ncbi:ATP-binding protein [Herbidospora galbida]|uniref:ATP-binding protein n=1 Tax=Herbidospora galbida TaxID=2575442 RepID=A0A4U3MEI8_9ACTN|nr:ATP-binding protein [Herbidospora galbida]TKK86146.1 ATP-binding protein [Herbidospora galbida]
MNEDGVAPPPAPGAAKEITFSLADLPDVREFAAALARRGGMPEDRVNDFLVALNEVTTNAVTHGATKARLRVSFEPGFLIADVHDEGRHWHLSSESPPGFTPPRENATSGMGLWVARRLSSEMRVVTGETGSTVVMRFPL